MMDVYELAGRVFGRKRAEGGASSRPRDLTVSGIATSDSQDGLVSIVLDGDMTQAEDDGLEHDGSILVPTEVGVYEGDEVAVTMTGSDVSTVRVTGVVGNGDRQNAAIAAARTIANAAQAVADAVNQHFWHDDNGAHVTQATKDEWEQEHSGPNSLWNSLGMLFRDGLNNLLAIVTNGIAIYDGNGNEDGNILAKFYTFVRNDIQHARVDFFNGKGFIDYDSELNTLQVSARDDSTATNAMNTARMNLYQSVNNRISNLELLAGANYGAQPAFIQLDSRNPSGGPSESKIYAYASDLLLDYYGSDGSTTVPMQQAVAALTTPLYSNSSNVTITSANTDISGASVTVPAGAYIIVVAYTFPAASGSGTRVTTIGYKPGSGAAQYNSFVQGSRANARLSMFNVVHITAQTTFTAYVRSDQTTSTASGLYIGMTRIS